MSLDTSRDRPLILMAAAILLVIAAALSFGQVGGLWLTVAARSATLLTTVGHFDARQVLEVMSVSLGCISALQGLVMLRAVLTSARVRMLALFPSYLVLSGTWGATFMLQTKLQLHWSVLSGLTGSLSILLTTASLIFFSGMHELELDSDAELEDDPNLPGVAVRPTSDDLPL